MKLFALGRLSCLLLLSLLALAGGEGSGIGSGGAAWAAAMGGPATEAASADRGSIGTMQGPRQVAGSRLDLPFLSRTTPRASGNGSPALDGPVADRVAQAPSTAVVAVLGASVLVRPGLTHDSALARSGALSSFGTSLPPPPLT